MYSRVFNYDVQPVNEGEGVTSRILAYGPGVLNMEWRFEKSGAVTPMHSHYHEQTTYVLEGSVKVTMDDGSEVTLKAGDGVYFAPNEGHAVVTLEDNCVVIDTFTPIRIDHLERHHVK